MNAQNPLFYQRVVPLDRDAHRDLRLRAIPKPLGYARESNLIPAVIDEFGAAASELAIAFLPGVGQPTAVFITGLRPGANLNISEEGLWTGSYVPAYLRRYPFIIGDVPEASPVLCIDEAYEGFNQDDGNRLFSDSGESETALSNALSIAETYRDAADRTNAFCAKIQQLDLLRTVTLDVKRADAQSTTVHGLMTIDEQAFQGLGDEEVLELHRLGYLKPVLAHLLSLRSVEKLSDKAFADIGSSPE
jgi:hypothetical protein